MRKTKSDRRKASPLLLSTLFVALAPGLAAAQSHDSQDGATTTEEVIVTANRREQNLQDVPQAVGVIDQRVLDATNSASLEGFAAYTPSVDLQYFAPGQTRVTIRGISPDEQTGVSTVSYYLDEIAITSAGQSGQPDVHLYDIDRVEFLRGPQGTLYGEGAMGGTIRIISRRPELDAVSASARANVSTIEDGGVSHSVDAMLNLPIIPDVFGLRIVANQRQDGGWIDRYAIDPVTFANNGLVREDDNRSDATSARIMARLQPTSRLTIDGVYVRNDLHVDSVNVANGGDRHLWFGPTPRDDVYNLHNITGQYDFDGARFISSSSLTRRQATRHDPEVGAFFFGPGVIVESVVQSGIDSDIFTQEFRLQSPDENTLRWTLGAYYRDGSLIQDTTRVTVPVVPIPGGLYTQHVESDTQTTAVFGEVEYDFTPRLTLIAGARWFRESADSSNTISGLFAGGVTTTTDQSGATTDVTPRLGVSYDLSDATMLYATYSHGYRSGGFNDPTTGVPPTYDPDRTVNYEIGVKHQSPDGRFTLNASAFYIDWQDLQFIQIDPVSGFFTYIGNANKASSQGLEIEAMFRPTESTWLSFGGTLNRAQLESDAVGNLTPVIPAGTDLPGVPDYRVSLAGGYDIPIGANLQLSLSASAQFTGASQSKLEEGGSFTIPSVGTFVIGSRLESYATGNLRAELSSDAWSAALYVSNVTNERAQLGDDNFGYLFGANLHYNQPRTIGVELSVNY